MKQKNKEKKEFNAVTVILIFIIVGLVFTGTVYLLIQHQKNVVAQLNADHQTEIENIKDQISDLEPIVVTDDIHISSKTVREVIAASGELIAYKYYYTDVGEFTKEDKKFKIFNVQDQTLYTYSGTIGAGIDLRDVDVNVDETNKEIVVIAPEPKILTNDFDSGSFKSYDVKNSKYVETTLDDYREFEEELKDRQAEKLKENEEFWTAAEDNIKTIISGLIKASGQADEFTIDYKWVKDSK